MYVHGRRTCQSTVCRVSESQQWQRCAERQLCTQSTVATNAVPTDSRALKVLWQPTLCRETAVHSKHCGNQRCAERQLCTHYITLRLFLALNRPTVSPNPSIAITDRICTAALNIMVCNSEQPQKALLLSHLSPVGCSDCIALHCASNRVRTIALVLAHPQSSLRSITCRSCPLQFVLCCRRYWCGALQMGECTACRQHHCCERRGRRSGLAGPTSVGCRGFRRG